jgi:hypothetical protein
MKPVNMQRVIHNGKTKVKWMEHIIEEGLDAVRITIGDE